MCPSCSLPFLRRHHRVRGSSLHARERLPRCLSRSASMLKPQCPAFLPSPWCLFPRCLDAFSPVPDARCPVFLPELSLPFPMDISLHAKRALVCGSTAGIGKAAAIELARTGRGRSPSPPATPRSSPRRRSPSFPRTGLAAPRIRWSSTPRTRGASRRACDEGDLEAGHCGTTSWSTTPAGPRAARCWTRRPSSSLHCVPVAHALGPRADAGSACPG
jgi:hypothetical protein